MFTPSFNRRPENERELTVEQEEKREERRWATHNFAYDIPAYHYMVHVMTTMRRERNQGKILRDAEGRLYFPAEKRFFSTLCEMLEGETSEPWIVVLPIKIRQRNPEFTFPIPDDDTKPWVSARRFGTQDWYALYCSEYDFSRSRATGIAIVTKICKQ